MANKPIEIKSKLFNLKYWLTIPETAKYLSIMFGEDVTEADILRLALDEHLKLSVYFVNEAHAKFGEIVQDEDIYRETIDISIDEDLENSNNPNDLKEDGHNYDENQDDKISIENLLFLGEKGFLSLDGDVRPIEGDWDLPLIGNERLYVENKYQQLVGGPDVNLTYEDRNYPPIIGTFIEGYDGITICQLLTKSIISEDGTSQSTNNSNWTYIPAENLPQDSVLVVRRKSLIDFQKKFSGEEDVSFMSQTDNPIFNSKHPFYAKELMIAVDAWTDLYEKNPPQHVPQGGHKKYITKWLEKNYPDLGQRALKRIATIVNPNPKGGASPSF